MLNSVGSRQCVTGLTLVELMVSAFLSSLIVLAAAQMYVTNAKSARVQSGLSQINEAGKFTFDFVRHELQMAGYGGALGAANISPVVWDLSAEGTDFDHITVQRRAGPEGDFTCTGAKTEPNKIYWSQYRVIAHGQDPTLKQLVCHYGLPSAFAQNGVLEPFNIEGTGIIVAGVESFQVLYGVTEADVFEVLEPSRFLGRDQVDVSKHQVVIVRLGLMIKSVSLDRVVTDFGNYKRQYDLQVLDRLYTLGPGTSFDDGQLRRVFETSVMLKNVQRAVQVQL